MNKNKKILKTIFALSAITMVAATPIALETINTENPKTADDGTPSIANVAAPVIESVTYQNSTTDGAKLVSVKFNFTTSTTIHLYEFSGTGLDNTNAFSFWKHTGDTITTFNLDATTYNNQVTETSVVIGQKIIKTTTYELLYRSDNLDDADLINGALNLRMALGIRLISDPALTYSSPRKDVAAIPINDANDVVTEISSITTSANDEDLEITFNLNKEAIPTMGWDIGERDSVPPISGARLHYKLSTDTDYTEITAFTTTGGSLTLGGDIPTADIVATTSIGTTFVWGSDYDFRVEYLFTADHKNEYSIKTGGPGDIIGTIDMSYTLPADVPASNPTISNIALNGDNTQLSFTANLGSGDEVSRYLDGTTSPIQLYTYDGTNYSLVTESALTLTSGTPLPADGVAFDDASYDFNLDISSIDAGLWDGDILQTLTLAVGYSGDASTVGFEHSSVIGSIPIDPTPSLIASPTIASDFTNAMLTFELSNSTTRGWEIGSDGVKILVTPSDGTAQYEATGVTFDQALSVGDDIPLGEIVATIPMTNFLDTTLSYDIVIESHYVVSSTMDDAIIGPVTLTSNVATLPPAVVKVITNLVVGQGTNGGEIDLSWDTNYTTETNTIHYFAVRDVLSPAEGWRIYSSNQASVTMVDDTTAIIEDPSFIIQGRQYDISVATDVDSTVPDDLAFYGDAWTGWDGLVSPAPVATIGVTTYATSYATPTTAPGDMVFTFVEATVNSLKYDFTYDNGSLEFNPIITVTANGTDVLATDVNIIYNDDSTTGTIELLRLVAETTYTVGFTYDYPQYGPEIVSGGTKQTLAAIPFIAVSTSLDATSGTFTITVEGDPTQIDDSTVNDGGTADLELIFDDVDGTILTLMTIPTSINLIGTHVFDISGVTGYTNMTLNIIVNEADLTTPLTLDNLIIDDGANEDVGIITTYTLNEDNAEEVIANEPTLLTPTTGINVGDLNISWLIDYPLGISLSDLGFTFEISIDPTDPTSWVDVSSQTNINIDMKSAVINDLIDPSYSEGVWVQITIDYLDISEDLNPLQSTTNGIPKQETAATGGLSTGALIGIIVGSIAGVALIALGGWFFYKKQNPSDPEDEQGVEPKEKSEFKEEMPAKKSNDMNSEGLKKEQPKKPTDTQKPVDTKKTTTTSKPKTTPKKTTSKKTTTTKTITTKKD